MPNFPKHSSYGYHQVVRNNYTIGYAKKQKPHHVYIIRILYNGTHYIKMGMSANIQNRVKSLNRVTNLTVISILKLIDFNSKYDAVMYEHRHQTRNDYLFFNAGLHRNYKWAGSSECYTQFELDNQTFVAALR